jgi:hypothetical protein
MADVPLMAGKFILVTGGTGGIGLTLPVPMLPDRARPRRSWRSRARYGGGRTTGMRI